MDIVENEWQQRSLLPTDERMARLETAERKLNERIDNLARSMRRSYLRQVALTEWLRERNIKPPTALELDEYAQAHGLTAPADGEN